MKPFFIPSLSGNVFALYHTPDSPEPIKRNILFIPPFAEELNRSRHMINRQARTFAKAGYGVLVLDLFGTGDSEGSFGQATLHLWQQDILAALKWLAATSDTPPILWAMRSGTLIAADLIQQQPGLTDQMILWSPVTNGKKFMTQYLRIKLAAEVTGQKSLAKTTVKDLWAKLDAGQNLEIAGYDLSPELVNNFAALSLADMKLPPTLSVKWLETSLSDPAHLSPGSLKVIEALRMSGLDICDLAVNGPAFWTLQGPEWAEKYIEQTLSLIEA